MPSSPKSIAAQRRLQFEQFEQRLVMSGQAIAAPIVELLPEMELAAPAITGQEVVWQQSESQGGFGENAADIAANIASQYGLDGSGQTIAVIDSGIAWDHYAFGSGFGQGNHVVGGWDFAENDANPYDDGPAGYHGSHVAGIIGSLDEQYTGVAAGADLVSLRVFDDNGVGNLDWVEQALQWVHENKDAFEHPITTVNLSLGTGWDPATTPGWGQLEDEFAKLESDGIFISVAAGNYYKRINDVGLSYPAVSEHVVPVASHDADGNLSDFSQRDDRVLVAPGEMLRSPVPDHLFGGTSSGQFLASSGTSMAAPYIAGVSSILREANWFMGSSNVGQKEIYDQLLATSDRIFDTSTGRYYNRVDLSAALEHVIADEHAKSLADATRLGELNSGDSITGTIGRLDDVDAIKFIATETGTVSMKVSVTHDLAAQIEAFGSGLEIDGDVIRFDVVAGQEYGFEVSTTAGVGHYEILMDYETRPAIDSIDLGVVVANRFEGLNTRGDSLFQVTPVRDGYLTIEANPSGNSPVDLEVYDQQQNLIGRKSIQRSATGDGANRLDIDAVAGRDYFFKLVAANGNVTADVSVTNLVSLDQGKLTVHGTHGEDSFSFSHDSNKIAATVNGVSYSFDDAEVDRVNVLGHHGSDSIDVALSNRNDKVATDSNGLFVGNESFRLRGLDIAKVSIDGGGGFDTALLKDTAGSDLLVAGENAQWGEGYWTSLSGAGYESRVTGFEVVHSISHGNDRAILKGTAGDETFVSRDDRNLVRLGATTTVLVDGYDQVNSYGAGGNDTANLFGSTASERFHLSPQLGSIVRGGTHVTVHGIDQVNAFSGSALDVVSFEDSQGRDVFYSDASIATLRGNGYGLYASGFSEITLNSVGGDDLAQLHDSSGNDTFRSIANSATLEMARVSISIEGIENVGFVADQGGIDRVSIEGSSGADRLEATDRTVRVHRAGGELVRVQGAEETAVDLLGGLDISQIIGGAGRDKLNVGLSDAEFESTLQMLQIANYEKLSFDGQDGKDSVNVEGPIDLLKSIGDKAEVVLEQRLLMLEDFSFLEASNVDEAIAAYDLEKVDFTYMLRGEWEKR